MHIAGDRAGDVLPGDASSVTAVSSSEIALGFGSEREERGLCQEDSDVEVDCEFSALLEPPLPRAVVETASEQARNRSGAPAANNAATVER